MGEVTLLPKFIGSTHTPSPGTLSSLCLFGSAKVQAGTVGGAFTCRVSLSATATGHTTPNDTGETCRETSSHWKESMGQKTEEKMGGA